MVRERILCVDDDKLMLFALHRDLESRFAVTAVENSEKALAALQNQGPFAVILADMIMPGMNGVELLAQAQNVAPDSIRVMLTGDEDKQTAVDAINEGRIFRFLAKPCAADKLIAALNAAVKQYQLVIAERELLEKTLNGSVNMLTELLATTEPEAFGRGQRLCEVINEIAAAMDITPTWELRLAPLLSQLGLVTLPPSIVQKIRSGLPLRDAEEVLLHRVPEIGAKLLGKIPRLQPAAEIVLYQNKGWDGSGDPTNLAGGSSIPIGARLMRVASDLFDIESKGVPRKNALEQLRKKSQVYDPRVLEALQRTLAEPSAPTTGRAVALKDLVAGCELVSAIETPEGMLIAPAGATLSETMLERIRNFAELGGIREPIYIKPPIKGG